MLTNPNRSNYCDGSVASWQQCSPRTRTFSGRRERNILSRPPSQAERPLAWRRRRRVGLAGDEAEDFQVIHAQQAARVLDAHQRIAVATHQVVLLLHLVEPRFLAVLVKAVGGGAVQDAAQRVVGGDAVPMNRFAGGAARRIDMLVAQVLRRETEVAVGVGGKVEAEVG